MLLKFLCYTAKLLRKHIKFTVAGPVTYIEGKVLLSFVAFKTKVAPLQSLSIPRLELMADVLGKQLVLSIAEILSIDREY